MRNPNNYQGWGVFEDKRKDAIDDILSSNIYFEIIFIKWDVLNIGRSSQVDM